MEKIRPALEVDDVNTATYFATRIAVDHRKQLEAYDADDKKDQRLAIHECKSCFYLRGGYLVGNAFTDWNCGVCNVVFHHPNTGTPRVCVECAKKNRLCTRCGGDFAGVPKRKKLCLNG